MSMVFEQIRGKLVVSCQALPHEPLHSSFIMSRMAVAAMEGGAAGIRAQSACDINAIAEVCPLPIIGIVKRKYDDSEIYITPTMKEVEELLSTRAEIIALDATDRERPGQEMGFDIVSTTLSGYTEYSSKQEGPDFSLIRRCAEELSVPVIAEGRIHCPEDLKKAFEYGAFSAVVGGAITRPQEITARFVKVLG